MSSDLIAIAFETEAEAFAVRERLGRLQDEMLVAVDDAAVVARRADGRVELHQAGNLTARGAVSGTFWGAFIGLLFGVPLLGLVGGAAAGALSGALMDHGIDDDFMTELGETLAPGTAALFVLVEADAPGDVLAHLGAHGGQVLRTTLSPADEARLRSALAERRDEAAVVESGGVD
ncbi:MAG: DUF1269 domain-containing protein [Myxococcales bacterium]|nr:DUF1269 domain-containing protein [Myxococcales bacterium]MCB9554196.1 DUF1269 domain-containing protein [Myxococcales bacterium]